MNTLLEKFEQQFAAFKAGRVAGDEFFDSISSNMFALRGDAQVFLNNVYVWAKEREAGNPEFFGLATILLCQLAMHEDRVEDGLKLSAQARQIFETINNEDVIALCTTMDGSFYRTLGNIDLALKAQYTVCNILKVSGKYPFFIRQPAISWESFT